MQKGKHASNNGMRKWEATHVRGGQHNKQCLNNGRRRHGQWTKVSAMEQGTTLTNLQ